ncbi:transmembrane protease serine 5 [Rhinophrynus dorsalis]
MKLPLCPGSIYTKSHGFLAQCDADKRKTTIKIQRNLIEMKTPLDADYHCTVQKILLLLFVVGVLAGTAVGVYILVHYFMRPLVYQDSVPLQDVEVTARCNDTDNEVATEKPRKVSFRINTENFLLEVQVQDRLEWMLTCYERWSTAWATLICRLLGNIRLIHHKGVNLTNFKLNHSQEFVQVPLSQTTGVKQIWQTKRGCISGRVVTLKCSECGSRSKSSRIIGGSDAGIGRWPWLVSLFRNNKHVCGGTIVSHQWIVTAAHCVFNYSSPQLTSWSILSGIVSHTFSNPKASASAVQKIIYHQKYDHRSHDYDIALIKLETPLNYSDSVRPVCLPQYAQEFPTRTECWISGWGYTHPDSTHMPQSLKEAMVPVISTKKCNSTCVYNGEITSRMLCAGYLDGKVDACQGDSGGPLVCHIGYTWRLAGVVSWGMGCAEPNHPGVYTKISSFLDWIHQIIEVLKYIKKNLQKGFFCLSNSPTGAGKKDGGLPPCLDYQDLNNITVKNQYPFPLIPELLDHLSSAHIYPKLNLRGVYNLVRRFILHFFHIIQPITTLTQKYGMNESEPPRDHRETRVLFSI